MGWFRSNGGKITWLAFFALACQFALTFGHIHFGNVVVISDALAISADTANGSAGVQSSPARKAPAGLARDFCAVCNNISLANTLVLPISPAAIPSISIIQNLQWSLVLLHHKFRRRFRGKRRAQHWHLRRVVAIATANRRWIVAIELGTWRCGRIGGAAGSITTGNGRFFDPSGGMWC